MNPNVQAGIPGSIKDTRCGDAVVAAQLLSQLFGSVQRLTEPIVATMKGEDSAFSGWTCQLGLKDGQRFSEWGLSPMFRSRIDPNFRV